MYVLFGQPNNPFNFFMELTNSMYAHMWINYLYCCFHLAGKFYHMSSFGEATAFKLKGTSAIDFCQYNKRQLSRIYPAGKRIDSSNYDPVEMWNMGCQIGMYQRASVKRKLLHFPHVHPSFAFSYCCFIVFNAIIVFYPAVALNLQTPGSKMDYNTGKFQQNGGCGYILKPSVMRSGEYIIAHCPIKMLELIRSFVHLCMYTDGLTPDTQQKRVYIKGKGFMVENLINKLS